MKIIEWNCQGAFRNKYDKILSLKPDLLIVLECESGEKLNFGKSTPIPYDFQWYGDSINKGVGIFSYSDYRIEILKEFNPDFRHIIPIRVNNSSNSFLLFAIWAMDNVYDPISRYIGQIWNAINHYKYLLVEDIILIGDFNSNKIWDSKEKIPNHTSVVNLLEEYKIYSLYHKYFDEQHGEEKINTFHMHRNLSRPYHIDYMFASEKFILNGFSFKVGNYLDWIDKSDHVPLIVDFENFNSSFNYNSSYSNIIYNHVNLISNETKDKFKPDVKLIYELGQDLDNELLDSIHLIEILKEIDKLKSIDRIYTSIDLLKYKNH